MTITIGPPAIDRVTVQGGDQTLVQKTSPATEDFYVTTVKLYFSVNVTDVVVTIVYEVSPNRFTSRSTAVIGGVASGYTEHSVSPMEVRAGDYIGAWFHVGGAGGIELSYTGGDGQWWGLPRPPLSNALAAGFLAARINSVQGEGAPYTPVMKGLSVPAIAIMMGL